MNPLLSRAWRDFLYVYHSPPPMNSPHLPTAEEIWQTRSQLPPDLIRETPLLHAERLSALQGNPVYIKDEGQQKVRSYKGRGSAAKMLALTEEQRQQGVVCASAGNHAQGVAAACNYFQTRGTIFMPTITPQQKIDATQRHGNGFTDITLHGDTFDETASEARRYAEEHHAAFLHPFDDWDVIRGQGTVGAEIAKQAAEMRMDLKAVLLPVGGGGLMASTILALKDSHPDTQIIGAEPQEAASMSASLEAGEPVTLPTMDTFVDGAAVARPGDRPFSVISKAVAEGRARMVTVSKGLLCATMADLFQVDGMLTEPAGALSIAALDHVNHEIDGAIACVLSGTNFDIQRFQSILEYAALHRRTKVYLGIHLPNRPAALREMLDALGSLLDAVNITFINFDTDQTNGDPSLHIRFESKTGEPRDINTLLNQLRAMKGKDDHPIYPFHEYTSKPKM